MYRRSLGATSDPLLASVLHSIDRRSQRGRDSLVMASDKDETNAVFFNDLNANLNVHVARDFKLRIQHCLSITVSRAFQSEWKPESERSSI